MYCTYMLKVGSMKENLKSYSQQMLTEVLNEDYMLSNKTSLTTYVQTDMKN
jgi:hypothetical protein